MASLQPIPRPRGVPFLGHIFAIDGEAPLNSFMQWARELGEIYSMTFVNKTFVVVNSARLAAECCDESKFHKHTVDTVLEEIRVLGGDGLFTAYHGEENWGVAHRILVPAFGPPSILGMFDDMYDITSQLVLKWERFGPQHEINPVDDFTRLAFDTIAICAMSHRLNSFYTDGVPPFVQAMCDFLTEADARSRRPSIVSRFMTATNEKWQADMKTMLDLARSIVDDRRAHPTEKKDLLNAMLEGRDPKTGKKLSDENIMQQMITFLSAGHETTASIALADTCAGMLSFLMHEVLTHREVYAKLQAEVDAIVGAEKIRREHIGRMPYLNAVMRETLRLRSPINGFSVAPFEDTVIGGKYFIKKGQPMIIGTMVHRDREAYGDDADEFKPERMLEGKFEALPVRAHRSESSGLTPFAQTKAWLPFGNGARGCIGRSFAWQEVQMVVVTLFQKFDFRLVDPAYKLQLKQTLVVKPDGLRFYAIPRKDRPISINIAPTLPTARTSTAGSVVLTSESGGAHATQPLYVLYGSNTGSCEMFAQRITDEAADHGFRASIGTLDSALPQLPADGAVVIVTSSFEGEPPDNACQFAKYIESLSGKTTLSGLRYAVFGCGNRDWVHTYQRVPKLVDSRLSACGAERIVELGVADASESGFMESFDEWQGKLWDGLAKALSPPTHRASSLRNSDAQVGVVTLVRRLTEAGAIEKHHIELQLPEGMSYRAGDYLAVLPTNPTLRVKRLLARFNLSPEAELRISSSTPTTLPTHRPVTASEVFSGYVELQQPATRKNVEVLSQYAKEGSQAHTALQHLLKHYASEVLDKRRSLLSILEANPQVDLPLPVFLGMLPAMRLRLYSISSSPLWDSTRAALTLSVLSAPALSGASEQFQGVASTFIAGLQPGDRVQVAVRPGRTAFHLPATPETPIVMFASGSGIAPMRGFLQERAAQKAAGRDVGRSLLFFGCRAPDIDYLYGDEELAKWSAQGVVDVRPAFSRAPERAHGCKYVQDRIWHDRAEVIAAFEDGAQLYTCGTLRIALGVKEAWFRILEELHSDPAKATLPYANLTPEEFWASIQNERYAADIFG
ncbi:fatty acid hydroxylase [Auricularia subglabra TFB-10046 SS5]|nr:fatty acid hydroxylase [Auricularia subglabra TFB-10046 SS5]